MPYRERRTAQSHWLETEKCQFETEKCPLETENCQLMGEMGEMGEMSAYGCDTCNTWLGVALSMVEARYMPPPQALPVDCSAHGSRFLNSQLRFISQFKTEISQFETEISQFETECIPPLQYRLLTPELQWRSRAKRSLQGLRNLS